MIAVIKHLTIPQDMITLGIESSCDETSGALVRGGKQVLGQFVASQIDLHRSFGGVVPEVACRAHMECLLPGLEQMLKEGRFRKDLFYRLNVIRLHISPLRDRREDIVELSRHLLGQLAREANLVPPAIDAEARRALIDYDWPGNVRELSNALERALSTMPDGVIRISDLPFHIFRKKRPIAAKTASIREVQDRAEKEAIAYALKACQYNKAKAARMLGIHRTLLYKKMKKHQLPIDLRE